MEKICTLLLPISSQLVIIVISKLNTSCIPVFDTVIFIIFLTLVIISFEALIFNKYIKIIYVIGIFEHFVFKIVITVLLHYLQGFFVVLCLVVVFVFLFLLLVLLFCIFSVLHDSRLLFISFNSYDIYHHVQYMSMFIKALKNEHIVFKVRETFL